MRTVKTIRKHKNSKLATKEKMLQGTTMEHKKGFKTIDQYIATFPKNLQSILQELRQVIKESAPEAEETISYQMPAFKQNGVLVYFAAFKNHIGFFPTSSPMTAFKEELANYQVSKGTIRFPLNEPIPFRLGQENCEVPRKRKHE
jgi:uncharacterized protein YdhG (YjbR/CyaY superfamily)